MRQFALDVRDVLVFKSGHKGSIFGRIRVKTHAIENSIENTADETDEKSCDDPHPHPVLRIIKLSYNVILSITRNAIIISR